MGPFQPLPSLAGAMQQKRRSQLQEAMMGMNLAQGAMQARSLQDAMLQRAQQQKALESLQGQFTEPAARILAQAGDLRGAVGRQFPQAAPITPQSPAAKLQADYNAGLIDEPTYRAALDKITKIQPPASVTVNNALPKIELKTGEGLAGEIGGMVRGSKEAAKGAVAQLGTANRMRAALESGEAIVGPGATIRLKGAQIAQVLGVGGKSTEEKIRNTRSLIKGLAEFTVAARSALKGQGSVSDFEGKVLAKAESGEIDDLTVPEIQILADLADRAARLKYNEHAENMKALEGNENYRGLVPFYKVPPLPESFKPKGKAGAQSGGVKFLGFE